MTERQEELARRIVASAGVIDDTTTATVLVREFSTVLSTYEARVAQLEAMLQRMVKTQDDWEQAVEKIIGKPAAVFRRDIDDAKDMLRGTLS